MLKIAVMSAGIVGGIFTGDVPLAMIFGFVMILGLLADGASVPSLSPLEAEGIQNRGPFLRLPAILRKKRQAARDTIED